LQGGFGVFGWNLTGCFDMSFGRGLCNFIIVPGLFLGLAACTQTYSVNVLSTQKVSDVSGNLNASLNDGDQFGAALANVGDLNGDGTPELAVGSPYDDQNGTDRGALWVLFMSPVSVGYRADPNVSLDTYFSGNG